jgi:signal transduction histidine kinase
MAVDREGIHKQQNLAKILLCIFLGSIISIFFMGQLYARRVLAPVVNIIKNVRKINATNLSLRLKEKKGNDELTELTRMFNQMLERLDNSFTMQKRFISNASHELKNPLTAILGETEVTLSKPRKGQEYVKALNNIQTEADRLNMLTKNLLNLAQVDFDLSGMDKQKIDIGRLISEIKEEFDKTDFKNRIEIHCSGSITVNGNHDLLQIALKNLLDNACKFSENQKVIVNLIATNEVSVIEIIDLGIGIPENESQNLFQPFFRASNTFPFKGSGIGLSLADKIIKLHEGHIDVVSNSDIGTTVKIYFNQLIPTY